MKKKPYDEAVLSYAMNLPPAGQRSLDISYPVITWLGIDAALHEKGKKLFELEVRCTRVLPAIRKSVTFDQETALREAEEIRAKRRAKSCRPDWVDREYGVIADYTDAMTLALKKHGRPLVIAVLEEALPHLKTSIFDPELP